MSFFLRAPNVPPCFSLKWIYDNRIKAWILKGLGSFTFLFSFLFHIYIGYWLGEDEQRLNSVYRHALTSPFVFQNSESSRRNCEFLCKVTWHGMQDRASLWAQSLWRKQLVPYCERADISCHASCTHSLLFAISPLHAFPCSFYLTLEASESVSPMYSSLHYKTQ